MKNENRIIELLAESLQRQDLLFGEVREMRQDIGELRQSQVKTNKAVTRVANLLAQYIDSSGQLDNLEGKE